MSEETEQDRERRANRKAFLKVWGQIAVLVGIASEGGMALWKAHHGADAEVVKEVVQTNYDHAEAAYAKAVADERDLQLLHNELGTLRQEVNEARARFMEILLQLARDQPQYREVSLPTEGTGLGGIGQLGGPHVAGGALPPRHSNLNPAAVLLQDRLMRLAEPTRKTKAHPPAAAAVPPQAEAAPAPSSNEEHSGRRKIDHLLEQL